MGRLHSILVLDDEVVIRDSMAAFLEDHGFHVDTAESAEQATEMLARQRFDLVVVDIRLPGERGDDFILQVAGRYPHLAFLVHTGSVRFQVSDALRRHGVDQRQVFLKPLHDMQPLVRSIEQRLGIAS